MVSGCELIRPTNATPVNSHPAFVRVGSSFNLTDWAEVFALPMTKPLFRGVRAVSEAGPCCPACPEKKPVW